MMMNQTKALTSILLLACALLLAPVPADAVPQAADEICPILVGQTLPPIAVKAPDGTEVDLNAVVALKPTVLIYYRGGW